jgi:hypothetical protein
LAWISVDVPRDELLWWLRLAGHSPAQPALFFLLLGFLALGFSPRERTSQPRVAPAEFFSVIGTNVYASIAHRPLRRDRRVGLAMPERYANLTTGPALFHADFDFNFDNVKARKRALYDRIQAVGAPWNPFL